MIPSAWLYAFLKSYEKFRPTAYKPTSKDVWTIGYGHTRGVKDGDTCSLAQADEWMHQDIGGAVIDIIQNVKVKLTQAQFDALVSLVFNCGADPLTHTLGHKLNAGDYVGAAAEFKKWDHQAGKELDGLEKRRVAEAAHFMAP